MLDDPAILLPRGGDANFFGSGELSSDARHPVCCVYIYRRCAARDAPNAADPDRRQPQAHATGEKDFAMCSDYNSKLSSGGRRIRCRLDFCFYRNGDSARGVEQPTQPGSPSQRSLFSAELSSPPETKAFVQLG